MQKSFVRGTWQVKRAFSPAVITEGAGRMIFIAGHTGQADDAGKSLAGDFDAQFRQTFRNIEKTLEQAGAETRPMTPEQFGQFIQTDIARWSKLARERKISLDD